MMREEQLLIKGLKELYELLCMQAGQKSHQLDNDWLESRLLLNTICFTLFLFRPCPCRYSILFNSFSDRHHFQAYRHLHDRHCTSRQ